MVNNTSRFMPDRNEKENRTIFFLPPLSLSLSLSLSLFLSLFLLRVFFRRAFHRRPIELMKSF